MSQWNKWNKECKPNILDIVAIKSINYVGTIISSLIDNFVIDIFTMVLSSLGSWICGFGISTGAVIGATSILTRYLLFKPFISWIDRKQSCLVCKKCEELGYYITSNTANTLYCLIFVLQWLLPLYVNAKWILPRVAPIVNSFWLTEIYPKAFAIDVIIPCQHPLWFSFSGFTPATITLFYVMWLMDVEDKLYK